MTDNLFLSFFDLARPSMREAKAQLDSNNVHAAALVAARHASEGPVPGAIHGRDVAATRSAIQKHFPQALDADKKAADLWLRSAIPSADDMGYVDNCKFGTRARSGRKRGNETLGLALLYATTGERAWAGAAIKAGLKSAAEYHEFPHGPRAVPAENSAIVKNEAEATNLPAYSWHPLSVEHMSHDGAHRLQYWMQAWPLLDSVLNDEDRLAWMKSIILNARDLLRANRHEIPFNLTFHPLLPCLQVAVAFPALRESREWIAIVADRIERDFSTPPSVTTEGYTREGSSYHNVNTRLLTLSYLTLLRGLGRSVPAIKAACEGAYGVQSSFVCPDGSLFLIGDSVHLAYHEHWQDAHEALQLGAALFNRPEWKSMSGSLAGNSPELLNLWLMGPEGIDRWLSWPAPDVHKRTLPTTRAPLSAFHTLRSGQGIDGHAGLLCFGMEHNHAHHDKGQALIYGLGRHLLSDPGHPGYSMPGDMIPGYSAKLHGSACPIRRTPMGPRTDFAEHARTLGQFEDETISVALGEHIYFENHVVQRALALVSPWGRKAPEAFWLMWDRLAWRRPWPANANEPMEMIDTVFPFHAPGCGAKISSDGRSVWSQYDGPEGMPFVQRGPMRREYNDGNELSDSDANIQITRLETAGSGAACDIEIRPGQTVAHGGPTMVPRPLGVYRWRGFLPHVAAYALIPFRGVRDQEFAAVQGETDKNSLRAVVQLPRGKVEVTIGGFESGKFTANVKV